MRSCSIPPSSFHPGTVLASSLLDLVQLDREGCLWFSERGEILDEQSELRPPSRGFRGEGFPAGDGSGRSLKDVSGLLRLNERAVSTTRLAPHSTTPTIAQWRDRKVLVIGAEDGHFYSLPLQP